LQQKIVAVDTTSLYPPAALQEKPNVGYMRQLSAEGVLALSPTLILALQGSGPKETIDILGQSKIPFVAVPDKAPASSRRFASSRKAPPRPSAENAWSAALVTSSRPSMACARKSGSRSRLPSCFRSPVIAR
jgi:Periplasmic binding protein